MTYSSSASSDWFSHFIAQQSIITKLLFRPKTQQEENRLIALASLDPANQPIIELCLFRNILNPRITKEQEDASIISLLQNPPSPLDYPSCMFAIYSYKGYLSSKNPIIRTLAAKAIIKLAAQALTLAYLFFGFSKSAIKSVANGLLGIVAQIGDMQGKGEISLDSSGLDNFKKLAKELVDIIYEDDPEEAKKILKNLLRENMKVYTEEFISSTKRSVMPQANCDHFTHPANQSR